MAKVPATKPAEALPAASGASHGRTPANTPIPGGGRWSWDEAQGAWVSLDPKPTQTADKDA